jgi:hypothetical protein
MGHSSLEVTAAYFTVANPDERGYAEKLWDASAIVL